MPGRILIAAIALLLAENGSSFAQPADHWRVTVQDAIVVPLAVSADEKLIAGQGEWADHFFHVVNRETSQILLSVPLPQKVRHVAISPDSRWFIVSTARHIYRIDLQDGTPQRLIEWVSGAVAIDKTGERLAVLGNMQVDFQSTYWHNHKTSQLGVYDLRDGKWITKIDTPVVIQNAVAFDGAEVIAAGIGGNVFSRKSQGHPCHVRLNPANGAITKRYGPDVYSPEMTPPEAVADYQVPPLIQNLETRIKAASTYLRDNQLRISPSQPRYPGSAIALLANDQRIASFMKHGTPHESLLTILPTGELTIQPRSVSRRLLFCRGRLLIEKEDAVTDVETDNRVLTLPQFPSNRGETNQGTFFMGSGWIVCDRDRLSYYTPDQQSPAWSDLLPKELETYSPLVISPDGNRLLFRSNNDRGKLCVLEVRSGKFILHPALAADAGKDTNFIKATFSRDGSQLAVCFSGDRREENPPRRFTAHSLRLYELPNQQVIYQRDFSEREYVNGITNVGRDWITGTFDYSLYRDESRGEDALILFPSIDLATAIAGHPDEAVLVENQQFEGGIITPAGQMVREWANASGDSRHFTYSVIPMSGVAFAGKVIARQTGTPAIELRDAQTFDTIAWVHVLGNDQGFEWIVYTPDGYWDASPGAEKFVLVTRNGSVVTPADLRSRRAASLLKSRLPK